MSLQFLEVALHGFRQTSASRKGCVQWAVYMGRRATCALGGFKTSRSRARCASPPKHLAEIPSQGPPEHPELTTRVAHVFQSLSALRSLRLLAGDSLAIALRVGCSVAAIELHMLGCRPCDCVLRLGGRCDCDW
eukprot:13843590-Alexandrium_andersonii.AAC.2